MILTLKIAPNVMLPTKPSMRIVKILGERRIDIPMEILNTTALHFYHVQNLDEEIKDCNKNPKLCTQFLTFEHLGTGTNIESGSASSSASAAARRKRSSADAHDSHDAHDSQDAHDDHGDHSSHDSHDAHDDHSSHDSHDGHDSHDDAHDSHDAHDDHDDHSSHDAHDSHDDAHDSHDDAHDSHDDAHDSHDDAHNSHESPFEPSVPPMPELAPPSEFGLLGVYGDNIIIALFVDNETAKFGGSYGFSVQFSNGLSKIQDGMENITLLDPAPIGFLIIIISYM